jgi:AraC family transcriptional regulator
LKLTETAMNLHPDAVVLKSSDPLNWPNLNVSITSARPRDSESVHGGGRDLWISMALDAQPLEISVIVEHREHKLRLRQNQLCIHPPRVVFGALRKNDARLLHVFLKGELLAEVMGDLFDRDVADLEAASRLDVHDPEIAKILHMMHGALDAPGDHPALRVEYLGRLLIIDALDRQLTLSRGKKKSPGNACLNAQQVHQVGDYIHERLASGITLDELAHVANLGRTTFTQRFRASFKVTPYQYIIHARIRQAQRLLQQTRRPIAEIALLCGFTDQGHFSRYFCKVAGLPPSGYRWQVERGV